MKVKDPFKKMVNIMFARTKKKGEHDQILYRKEVKTFGNDDVKGICTNGRKG